MQSSLNNPEIWSNLPLLCSSFFFGVGEYSMILEFLSYSSEVSLCLATLLRV